MPAATFKVLKQACGWEGVQQKSIPAYRRHLTPGPLAFIFLEQLKSQRRTTPYKLRRQLISRKLVLQTADMEQFLMAA